MTVLGPGSLIRTDIGFFNPDRLSGLATRPIRHVELTSTTTPIKIITLGKKIDSQKIYYLRHVTFKHKYIFKFRCQITVIHYKWIPSKEEKEAMDRVNWQALAESKHSSKDTSEDGSNCSTRGHHNGSTLL